ncbi:hypothetical protein ACWJJH_19030 [Endozoicomonadaceae bacterium StTr2]
MKYARHLTALLIPLTVLFSLLTGCAGRDPYPVTIRQFGDEDRSCASLEAELRSIESEINHRLPKTNKTGKNVALGITGVFFLVPWFFMDLTQSEQIEIDAYRQRYNHLVALSAEKSCSTQSRQKIPDFRDAAAFQAYQEEYLRRQQEQLNLLRQQQLQNMQQMELQKQIEQQIQLQQQQVNKSAK